jgi:ribose transport system permease protein
MKKVLGILGVLVVVFALASIGNPAFLTPYNLQNILLRTALYGILGIGAAFVIMAGGIDLSIGSVIGLVGCLLPMFLMQQGWPLTVALAGVLGITLLIGLGHGLLVTKLRLQPFVVTLCGLLIYRGAARAITDDQTQGFGGQFNELRQLATGKVPVPLLDGFQVPVPFLLMVALAIVAAVFLNLTIHGRYLLAVGRNEQAARYSGINTDRITILAYVLCAVLAGGIGGILWVLDLNSIQPDSHGSFYELYAIAAAVLGGCSLRGGEGSILGVVLGAALIPVLYNASNVLNISTKFEFATIGIVILAGAVVDELVKRLAAARRARRERAGSLA